MQVVQVVQVIFHFTFQGVFFETNIVYGLYGLKGLRSAVFLETNMYNVNNMPTNFYYIY